VSAFDKYQKKALTTAMPLATGEREDSPLGGLLYNAVGLSGEAGEFLEKVKKLWRDQSGPSDWEKELLAKELGDALWYIANAADVLGFKLNDIAEMNLQKLRVRKDEDKLYGEGDER